MIEPLDFQTATLIALMIVFLIAVAWGNYKTGRDGGWHTISASDYRYRRFANGKWEYRDMTPDEMRDWQDVNAW